jgi:hypothetical protein
MPSPTIDPVNGWGIGGFGDAFFGGIATKTIDADSGTLALQSQNTLLALALLIKADSGGFQTTGNSALLNALRNLSAFNLNSAAFLINGFNSRALLEVDMFIQSPISAQDKQDIANAIINATKTIPIEAKIVEQTVAVTSQIAEAVVNDPKTLTTAKFLGLK